MTVTSIRWFAPDEKQEHPCAYEVIRYRLWADSEPDDDTGTEK